MCIVCACCFFAAAAAVTFLLSPVVCPACCPTHSVMTCWPSEAGAVLNMIEHFGTGAFATVMDSYDYTAALNQVLPGEGPEGGQGKDLQTLTSSMLPDCIRQLPEAVCVWGGGDASCFMQALLLA